MWCLELEVESEMLSSCWEVEEREGGGEGWRRRRRRVVAGGGDEEWESLPEVSLIISGEVGCGLMFI